VHGPPCKWACAGRSQNFYNMGMLHESSNQGDVIKMELELGGWGACKTCPGGYFCTKHIHFLWPI